MFPIRWIKRVEDIIEHFK